MHCISPIKAAYSVSGDLIFNNRNHSKELVGIQFECRKCLPCRLNIAREKAIRCIHEASQHEDNIFLTLTYDEQSLKSPKLIYKDWQDFAKRLRESSSQKITYMVTGEYGEQKKRPHWHAIIFNYKPNDSEFKYTTELGEQVFTSPHLTDIWGNGTTEYGSVTMESAGYVARYAAKKLVHGFDQDHDFHPIHKTSSRRAIGRSWIEKYYEHTFQNGFIVLPNGQQTKIPRYYVDWAKKHKQDYWENYIINVRPKIQSQALENSRKEEIEFLTNLITYKGDSTYPLTRPQVKESILKLKFKRLQENLKL